MDGYVQFIFYMTITATLVDFNKLKHLNLLLAIPSLVQLVSSVCPSIWFTLNPVKLRTGYLFNLSMPGIFTVGSTKRPLL